MTPEVQAILSRAEDGRLSSCLAAVRELSAMDREVPWRARAKIRVLRNFTAEPLAAPLALAAYRRGIRAEVSFSDYDAHALEILDPGSKLDETGADLAVLALWLGELRLAEGEGGALDAARVVDHVEGLTEKLLARGPKRVALNTMLFPRHRVSTLRDEVALARINLAILSLAERNPRVVAVDLRRLVEELGEARALDARGAFTHRAEVAPPLAARWAEALADAVAALHGAPRKVLALDCDNTLWGGVVGEDGLLGIRLSDSDYPGRAFQVFQEQVIALSRAGVLVALCSKNEEADVLAVLEKHPACRLRQSHLAARRINWQSKVENLRSIAAELNVGLESFVFIDDSPFECAMVREALPMIDVRRVPERAADLPALLAGASGAFATAAITAEDRARTASIQAEARRAEAARDAGSVEAFLASLELRAQIGPAGADSLARVAQLTARTNQWNLTTRRYDIDQISRLAESEEAALLTLRAADRFGDYGLVGVGLALREGGEARIDTLLLSCRALGRRLEDALLAALVAEIGRRFGPVPVRGEYLATQKNAQVARFFEARGFTLVDASEARRVYLLPPDAPRPAPPARVRLDLERTAAT